MVLPRLDRRGPPALDAAARDHALVVEGVVVLGADRFADLREDVPVRVGSQLGIGGRVERALVGDDVRRRAAVVPVDVDVGRPRVHHLGDQRVDLLRLELHVVAVHVVAGFVGPPAHLAAVGVDQRQRQHDHVAQQRPELPGDQLLGDELHRLLGRDLPAVHRRCQQHDRLARAQRVLRVGDRGIGDGDEEHLAIEQRAGDWPHVDQVARRVEVVPEPHQRFEGRRSGAEVLLLLPRLRQRLLSAEARRRGDRSAEGDDDDEGTGTWPAGHEVSTAGNAHDQNATRTPPLNTRPSSGAQASTVQRPSARASRPQQRVPARLADVGHVLGVDEDAPAAEALLGQQTDDDIGSRLVAVRVHVEALQPGVVDLDADATGVLILPHAHQPGAVPGREGDVLPAAVAVLARLDVGVAGCRYERRVAERAQELDADVGRVATGIAQDVAIVPVHDHRVIDPRGKDGRGHGPGADGARQVDRGGGPDLGVERLADHQVSTARPPRSPR